MNKYSELAIATLKDKGFRVTKPRRLVVELLDRAERPLSAYEIKDMLDAQGEHVDTVSIYRILETLEENRLIHRVLSTGKVRKCSLEDEEHCGLSQEEHCHHFLICERCGAIEEVHCPGTAVLVSELEKLSAFKIKGHTLEFTGLCPKCN